jgi:hypothetical protein
MAALSPAERQSVDAATGISGDGIEGMSDYELTAAIVRAERCLAELEGAHRARPGPLVGRPTVDTLTH